MYREEMKKIRIEPEDEEEEIEGKIHFQLY